MARIPRNIRFTKTAWAQIAKAMDDLGVNRHDSLFKLVNDGFKVHEARQKGHEVVIEEERGGEVVRTRI